MGGDTTEVVGFSSTLGDGLGPAVETLMLF